jgi:hypothetical protein
MKSMHYSFEEGFQFVQKKRNCIFPNSGSQIHLSHVFMLISGFIEQLKSFEEKLKKSEKT